MSIALSSPVTGTAQTGFTSPTYTHVADRAPDVNGLQYAVTALGGTQAGVSTHSASAPFTITFWRPKTYKVLGNPNPVTGVVSNVPMNTYKIVVRKGVLPGVDQPSKTAMFTLTCDIPAGSDVQSPSELRAALSLLFGAVSQQSAGWGDTVANGIL